MMRRKTAVLVIIIFCLLAGCGKKESNKGKNVPGNAVTGGAVTGGAADGGEMTALERQSRDYTEQIVAGLYSPLFENMTTGMANQLTEDSLAASWNSVAGNLTGYCGVESAKESENDSCRIVLVTLRYGENQGVTVKFIYDGEGHIAGLWFDREMLQNEETDSGENSGETYKETDITIGRAPYELSGKLVLPTGVENPLVVILVAGPDDMDMDGTIGEAGNTPLRDLARGLAEYGVASLRYNKRKYQYPSKVAEDSGIYDLLTEDVGFAVDKMYNSRQVDGSRIVIAAQGKAADYLPAIVEKKARRLKGAIMMAGKPIQMREDFYTDKKKTVNCNAKYFIDTNSILPLFILQGDMDFETPVEEYEKWQTLLKGRSHIVYRLYRGLNHYFTNSAGKTDATDYDGEGKFSAFVIKELGKWLTELG